MSQHETNMGLCCQSLSDPIQIERLHLWLSPALARHLPSVIFCPTAVIHLALTASRQCTYYHASANLAAQSCRAAHVQKRAHKNYSLPQKMALGLRTSCHLLWQTSSNSCALHLIAGFHMPSESSKTAVHLSPMNGKLCLTVLKKAHNV